MEQEHFISGYCRQLDGSRTVTVLTQDGALSEVDCEYFSCPYASVCTIAKEIEKHR